MLRFTLSSFIAGWAAPGIMDHSFLWHGGQTADSEIRGTTMGKIEKKKSIYIDSLQKHEICRSQADSWVITAASWLQGCFRGRGGEEACCQLFHVLWRESPSWFWPRHVLTHSSWLLNNLSQLQRLIPFLFSLSRLVEAWCPCVFAPLLQTDSGTSPLVLHSGLKLAGSTEILIVCKGDLKPGFAQGKSGKRSQLQHLDKHNCDISHHSVDFVSCRCHHKCCYSAQNIHPSDAETIPSLSEKSRLLSWVQKLW